MKSKKQKLKKKVKFQKGGDIKEVFDDIHNLIFKKVKTGYTTTRTNISARLKTYKENVKNKINNVTSKISEKKNALRENYNTRKNKIYKKIDCITN